MAGSYGHATSEDGQLYRNEDFIQMVENLGDAYETAEEMYGMIWWLASQINRTQMPELVAKARASYRAGLNESPGTEGRLPDDDE